jgi:hypothetical protein
MTPAFLSTFKPDLQYADYPELMEKLNVRVKPNSCSQAGFIAEDQDLLDVCQKDAAFLKEKGITHEQIADCLETVITKARYLFHQYHSSSNDRINDPRLNAIVEEMVCVPEYPSTCGTQECPFSKDLRGPKTWCGEGKSLITIINRISGKCLKNITELHPHLIRDHHFFEGDTEYRLDPECAIDVLGIKPGVDYKLKSIGEHSWKGVAYGVEHKQKVLDFAKAHSIEQFQSETEEFQAFLLPYKDWNSYRYKGLTNRQKIENKGLKKNLTREQIDKNIKKHIKFDKYYANPDGSPVNSIDEQIWESDGKNYLHIFPFKKLADKNKVYLIAGGALSGLDIPEPKEQRVYTLSNIKIPILESGDRIESFNS